MLKHSSIAVTAGTAVDTLAKYKSKSEVLQNHFEEQREEKYQL